MMYSRLTFAAAVAALFRAATADLQIVVPGGDQLWWVANSENNIVWTCQDSPFANFTILVANSNPQILPSPIAIVAIEDNFDCSKTITPDQSNQAAGTGYMIQFANTLNSTDIYAQSQAFEIKPVGSTYPASSATPSASGTSTSSTSATAGGAASSSSSKSGAAASNTKISAAGLGLAAVGALFGIMA